MATAASSNKRARVNEKKQSFRWKPDMIENLIDCLNQYKAAMSYKSLDFDADKPIQYKELRLKMASLYEEEDISLFGAPNPYIFPEDFDSLPDEDKNKVKAVMKESKDLTVRGTKRIMEKVKEIRQNFSKAVVSGTRSGSGKIVFEYYDRLCEIWGGSANTDKLSFGVCGDDFESDHEEDKGTGIDDSVCADYDPTLDVDEDGQGPSTKKKRVDQVPQLVDEKRKHLERRLSAAQRDNLLLKEAKDDALFKKDMCDAIRELTATLSESVKEIGNGMNNIGNGICRSIEVLAQALMQPNQHHQPMNQNLFYQNDQMFHHPGGTQTHQLNDNVNSQNSQGSYGSQLPHYTNLR